MEQAEEYQDYGYPVAPRMSEHQSESSLRFQLTFDDIIEDLEVALQAKEAIMDSKTGKITYQRVPGGVPLLNDRGMSRMKLILRSHLSRLAPLSDLDDEDIRNIGREVEFNIRNTINDNWDEFEILDQTAATTIRSTLGTNAFINLKKAENGRFLRHMRSTHQSSEIQQIAQMQQQSPQKQTGILKELFGKR